MIKCEDGFEEKRLVALVNRSLLPALFNRVRSHNRHHKCQARSPDKAQHEVAMVETFPKECLCLQFETKYPTRNGVDDAAQEGAGCYQSEPKKKEHPDPEEYTSHAYLHPS